MLADELAIIAHRGECSEAPENSLASVKEALAGACTAIEIDVQLTQDGIPVLFHDRDCQRMFHPPMSGAIADYHWEQLQNLELEEHERLPGVRAPFTQLSDVVTLLINRPDVTLFIEVKRAALERFSYAKVHEQISLAIRPIQLQCVLISFSLPFLSFARSHNGHRLGVVLGEWDWLERPEIGAISPEYIFCNLKRLPEGFLFNTGSPTWVVYEVDTPELAARLFSQGLRQCESFSPRQLKAAIAGKGAN
ncbi:glycerophosphodiester phosphodiesterase family protein [Corallincola platygyrae]|uniref:Glycerophosphodiester phosphodiesterase family protein n=1 Tax=Corallincola platygyrae TaxID=1193278 RepID=A0ABW4XLM5_9GAMM